MITIRSSKASLFFTIIHQFCNYRRNIILSPLQFEYHLPGLFRPIIPALPLKCYMSSLTQSQASTAHAKVKLFMMNIPRIAYFPRAILIQMSLQQIKPATQINDYGSHYSWQSGALMDNTYR